jgi:hypothetical protein
MIIGKAPIPGTGPALVDINWLLALAGGQNFQEQNGVTALAGGAQAAAPVVGNPSGNPAVFPFLVEIDTVVTGGDSIQLPFARTRRCFLLRNNGAQSMNVFANPNNNSATGAADSINGGTNVTAVAVASNHSALVFCAKDGVWSMMVV